MGSNVVGQLSVKVKHERLEKVSKFCFAFYVFFVLRFSVCFNTFMCSFDNMFIWLSNFSTFEVFSGLQLRLSL